MKIILSLSLLFMMGIESLAQSSAQDLDSLKREILLLQTEVKSIQLNLANSSTKLKRGMIIASIGYTVTIAGGLMLGRKQDDLGKVLLVSGGVTGVIGTAMLVKSFQALSPKK